MTQINNRNYQPHLLEEEKPLLELPGLLTLFVGFTSVILGLSLLVLPWYLVLILFSGLAVMIGVVLNPFISIPIFLIGSYIRPLAYAQELVRFQLPLIAACAVMLAWFLHIIVYRDFKLIKTKQLLFIFGFGFMLTLSSVAKWDYSYFLFLDLVKVLILYFLVAYLVKTKAQIKIVLTVILFLGILSAIFALYQQMHGIGESLGGGVIRPIGFEDDPNHLALDIVLLLPLCLGLIAYTQKYYQKVFLFVTFLFFLGIISLTFSRAGLLGAVVVTLMCLWKFFGFKNRFGQLITILLIIVMLVPFLPVRYLERAKSMVDLQDVSIRGRLDGFIVGFWIMKDHPFTGAGMGNWPMTYFERAILLPDIQTKFSWFPHNLFIEIGAQLGIIALIAFIFFIIYIFKDLNTAYKNFSRKGESYLAIVSQIIQISFIGFLVCASFVAALQLKIFWMLAGFSIAIRELSLSINAKR